MHGLIIYQPFFYKMKYTKLAIWLLLIFIGSRSFAQQKPNVLVLYTDDLGYGDLSCYGAKAISTPNIDWLAENGRQFMDAHCTASTCTPSRF